MKKTIAILLSTFLLLPACAFNYVGLHNTSTSISDRMEDSSVSMKVKIKLTVHDEDTGEDRELTGWGGCSGVFIKKNVILSAAHCVDVPNKKITIKEIWVRRGGESRRATVIKFDRDADLALLYTELPGKPIKLANHIVRGEDIWVVGNPLGLQDIITKGIVSQTDVILEGLKSKFLIVDAMTLPGNSGGPVVDEHCHLVGILTRGTSMFGPFGATGLGIVVDVDTVRDFLNSK